MDEIYQKYIGLLARYGIRLTIEPTEVDAPATELLEQEDFFLLKVNPSRFDPMLSPESYVSYEAGNLLLPRLVLETDRLILRRYQPEDAADCFRFLSDDYGADQDCCAPFQAMDDAFYDRLELFAQRDRQYMLQHKQTGRVIGTINVFDDDSRAVYAQEIGYSIAPEFRRQGYGFEALSDLLRLLQEDLKIPMITAGILEENAASKGLLRKLGFQPEGIRHKAVWHEGRGNPVDLCCYYREVP